MAGLGDGGLAAHLADSEGTTVRANRLAIPALRFDMSGGLGFVVKDGVGDIHGFVPCEDRMPVHAC